MTAKGCLKISIFSGAFTAEAGEGLLTYLPAFSVCVKTQEIGSLWKPTYTHGKARHHPSFGNTSGKIPPQEKRDHKSVSQSCEVFQGTLLAEE